MYNYVVLQVDNLIAKSLFKCFQKELDKVLPAKRMQPSIPRIHHAFISIEELSFYPHELIHTTCY